MTAKQRAIRERLRELEEQNNGLLTPEVVVQDAMNPASVLHGHFEWDNNVAAHKYRLDQARQLIREVRYVETTTQVALSAPGYVHVTLPSGQSGYQSTDKVATEHKLALQVLNDEIKRARAALERARAVAGVLNLTSEVERAIEFIANIQRAAA